MFGEAITQVLFIGAGGLGAPELLIILFLAVLLFGANKLPKLARSSGQALGEFQKGREQVEQELDEMRGAAELEDDDLVDPELESDRSSTETSTETSDTSSESTSE